MFSCTWSVSIVFDLFCKVCWDHVSRWFCTLNEPIDWLITGHFSGTEARDSPYLHPGSVEVYRERGGAGSGNRGRSGRESPRSAVSSSHHRSQKQLRLPRLVCWDVVWNISHISCFLFFFFSGSTGPETTGHSPAPTCRATTPTGRSPTTSPDWRRCRGGWGAWHQVSHAAATCPVIPCSLNALEDDNLQSRRHDGLAPVPLKVLTKHSLLFYLLYYT